MGVPPKHLVDPDADDSALSDRIAKMLVARLRNALLKPELDVTEQKPEIIKKKHAHKHTGGPAADSSQQLSEQKGMPEIIHKNEELEHTAGPAADGSLQGSLQQSIDLMQGVAADLSEEQMLTLIRD